MLVLTKEGKREFLDKLYEFLNENKLTALDYQRIKILSTAPICPRCDCEYVTKAGKSDGRQVYKCKKCGYRFRETAKSLVYYSHKYYLLMNYIKCILEESPEPAQKLALVYQQVSNGDIKSYLPFMLEGGISFWNRS